MGVASQLGRIRAVMLAAQEVIEISEKYKQYDLIESTKKNTFDTVLRIVNEEDYCPWNETGVDYEHF